MFCPDKYVPETLLARKTFQSLGTSDFQGSQCALSMCQVRIFPLNEQTYSFSCCVTMRFAILKKLKNHMKTALQMPIVLVDILKPKLQLKKCDIPDSHVTTPRSVIRL